MNKYIYIKFLIFLTVNSFSQSSIPYTVNFPATPSVASLARHADVPVSYYNGSPNINMPLYTIETGGFTLPISLNYNASGIKVSQEASNVGLGWSLNAGGIITRQTRGGYDFSVLEPLGYFFNKDNYSIPENDLVRVSNTAAPSSANVNGVVTSNLIHQKDGEPDLFVFNFAGYSGRFILQSTEPGKGKGILVDRNSNLKVDLSIENGSYTFSIKDQNGTRYEFSLAEKSESLITSGIDFSASGSHSFTQRTLDSWLLTKIVLNNGQEINFKYDPYGGIGTTRSIPVKTRIDYIGIVSTGVFCAEVPVKPVNYTSSFNTVTRAYILKEIDWPGGVIKFETSGRRDVYWETSTDQKINHVKVFSKPNNELVKHYELTYNYFKNNNPSPQGISMSWRLKLLSLIEHPVKNVSNTLPKTHQFKYDETLDLPFKDSNNYDHWGYFNNKGNNRKEIIPEENDPQRQNEIIRNLNLFSQSYPGGITIPSNGKLFSGADRSPDLEASKSGTLTQIKYPTGGVENFEYELHTYLKEQEEEPFVYVNKSEGVAYAYDPNTNENPFNIEANFTITGEVTNFKMRFGYTDEVVNIIRNNGYTQASQFRVELWKGSQMVKSYLCVEPLQPSYSNDFPFIGCDERFLEDLYPGNYKLKINILNYLEGNSAVVVNAGISYSEKLPSTGDPSPDNNTIAGGLRIKRISSEKNIREFNYNDSLNLSTGILIGDYNYNSFTSFATQDCQGDGSGVKAFFIRQSNSNYPLTGGLTGNVVGYSNVTEKIIDPNSNNDLKTVYHFKNLKSLDTRFGVPHIESLLNGKLIRSDFYKNNHITRSIENKFIEQSPIPVFAASFNSDFVRINKYVMFSYHTNLIEKEIVDYYGDPLNPQLVKNTESYFYHYFGDYQQRTKILRRDANENLLTTIIKYPQDIDFDLPSNPSYSVMAQKLMEQNRFNIPYYSKNEILRQNNSPEDLSHQHTVYKEWGNNANNTNSLILPHRIWRLKGPFDLDFEMDQIAQFYEYDNIGNPLEVSQENGVHISYIWSYNKMYPVAKIENATFAQVANALEISQYTLSNFNENSIDSLNNLRSHPNMADAQITTYTYQPLVGITSMTDPRGYTMTYHYDDFNRLKHVKDHEGNILNKNEYNYQN